MIKLNRTTEYGLVALRHMSLQPHRVASAREISDAYGFPFEILAKTLQRLKDTGLIQSAQGARGGYMIQKPLSEVNLAQFIRLMEGQQGVVACTGEGVHASGKEAGQCEFEGRCELRSPMHNLNERIYRFLATIRLDEIAGLSVVDPTARRVPVAASSTLWAEEP